MATTKTHELIVREAPPDPYSAATFDVLLIDTDSQRAFITLRAIESSMEIRYKHHTNGRDALESFKRARYNAIVCRPHFGDIVCRNWIQMIRIGAFGYKQTPVIVLCDTIELKNLAPMVDEHTVLVHEGDSQALTEALIAIKTGDNKKSVLVVEDEHIAARAAEKALEKYYRVTLAHDGMTAQRLWRQHHHDIVLLDLMLPDISGAELLRVMLQENPNQIVIIVTAHDAPDRHQELILAGGASDFVSKPVDTHLLPEVCAGALRAMKCLTNIEHSRAEASDMMEVATRLRAADYHYERGQAAYGSAHLKRALASARAHMPDEDYWASIQAELKGH